MGGNSSSLRIKSRSSSDLDRIKPTSEQRTPKTRGKLASLAQSSSKQLSKLSFKRKGGSRDKAKSFRELIASWPLCDLEELFKELDTSRIISTLRDASDLARPAVPSIGFQLLNSSTQNLTLVYKEALFPVHRCLVTVRSSFIDSVAHPGLVEVSLSGLESDFEVEQIRSFVHYLYTDEWTGTPEELIILTKSFGCSNTLEAGLLEMEKRGLESGDLTIILTTRALHSSDDDPKLIHPEYTIRAHSELVGGRSSLLGSLVKKSTSSRIVLDEALLPRGFAPLAVHFLYTDKLDLTKISDCAVSQSSLSEARAIVAGRSPHSPLHRAIQLVHIAMFFSLDRLAQLCEDVMVSSLCPDSCVSVLSWALDGGSQYVARQAQRYLECEFSKIALSHHLFDVSLESLVTCVESQFTQATEVEILEAVVRWGEHELLKRMEEREPNIVADTSHSISRRGIRRADISGEELNCILSPLTRHIRTDYVLPPFHQSLNSAYRRGILERAPLRDLVCPATSEINPDIHWFHPEQLATGPRFYQPYFSAAKSRLVASLERGESSFGRIVSLNSPASLDLDIQNVTPELLDASLFEKFRLRLLETVDILDSEHHIRFFPRLYQRRMAIELISLRILRELSIDTDTVTVRLLEDQDYTVRVPSGLLHPPQSMVDFHSSQPSLHWPDIMTLERRKPAADEQKSGEYDPTPDDDISGDVRF